MVTHANKKTSQEHVRCYNGPQSSEIFASTPGTEDDIVVKQDIVIRRGGQLNANGNELFATIPNTHRAYRPLCYALLPSYGKDSLLLGSRCEVPSARQSE